MLWTASDRRLFRRLSSPGRIQAFLDGLAYRAEDRPACPLQVARERRAHCLDGALFGAAALRRLGHPPLLMDLRAVRDDDHVLAVYRVRGAYGAVAKSNFVGLRFREPIHRTLRELALSYFDDYFNLRGERTLREYSSLLSLRQFDRAGWEVDDALPPLIAERLDALPHRRLLTPAQERGLGRADQRTLQGGMVGTLAEGVHRGG
jgi:hypothetical protein